MDFENKVDIIRSHGSLLKFHKIKEMDLVFFILDIALYRITVFSLRKLSVLVFSNVFDAWWFFIIDRSMAKMERAITIHVTR